MPKGYEPVTARATTFEVKSGKLVLTGPWTKFAKRPVSVSIFPDDVQMLKRALETFERNEGVIKLARKTAKEERKQKREAYAERKRAAAENMVDGVRVIGD